MKKILLLISLFGCLASTAQDTVKVLGYIVSGAPAEPTYVNTRTFYINFDRSDQTQPLAPWNNTATDFPNWTSIGGVHVDNMTTSAGASSSVGGVNTSAYSDIAGNFINTTGPNKGVWPDLILVRSAMIADGGGFKITGLDPTKYYTIYYHFATSHYESVRAVYASAGGKQSVPVGSSYSGAAQPRNPIGNWGEDAGNGLQNTSLDYISLIQSNGSGEILNTFTRSSGTGNIPLTSIVIQEYSLE